MIKYKIVTILLLATVAIGYSCSDKIEGAGGGEADGQVSLSGLLTRADGDVYPNLYLKAVVAEDTSVEYIPQTAISTPDGLEDGTPNDIILSTPRYYPLGDNDIRFFAYSQPLNGSGEMRLTSGTALTNDALLSNRGYRKNAAGVISAEGEGTPGSSLDPATILQFRHVMTKIDVVIHVDSTEMPTFVDPPPTEVHLRLNNLAATGTYAITNKAPVVNDEDNAPVAGNISGDYTLREGTNYVVPTGAELTDGVISSLRIDDYTATAADLAALAVTNLTAGASAPLVSGYAYTLTINLRRLAVGSVILEQKEWDAEEIDMGDIGFEPYDLALELGDYDQSGSEDQITKVILWASDGREYVGGPNEDNTGFDFVILPSATVDSVALYTGLGMLIRIEPDSYNYVTGGTSTLTLELSKGGMRLEVPGDPPGEDNPYLIYTPVQIFNMSKELDVSYKQMADLDISRLTYESRAMFVPLGTFTGYFDGNGFRINNMMLTGMALVERNEGTIKNLNIDSGRINAKDEAVAGSICAVNAGMLVACINGARIVGGTGIAGGICGINEAGGKIIACVNNGDVVNGVTLGGICGTNQNAGENTIVACINTGLMAKTATTIGGMIGISGNSPDVVILNSFWLVGTAAHQFGGAEVAVGAGDIGLTEVTALSPEKLRDSVASASDVEPTLNLLNEALQQTGYGTEFIYVLDQNVTGIVWPVPVMRN